MLRTFRPQVEEVGGDCRKLQNEIHNLYSSDITMIKYKINVIKSGHKHSEQSLVQKFNKMEFLLCLVH